MSKRTIFLANDHTVLLVGMKTLLAADPGLHEGINGDLKQEVTSKPPARRRPELERNIISRMRKLSRSPRRVRSLFQHRTFRYAA